MTNIILKPEFYHLMTESKQFKGRRNKKRKLLRMEHERELLEFLVNRGWSGLVQNTAVQVTIQLNKKEVQALTQEIYSDSSSLIEYYDKIDFLISVVKTANKILSWDIAIPNPVHLMPNQTPLLSEYEFIELNAFRSLEAGFEQSLYDIEGLSPTERLGQILFSAIANGALFDTWKQKALMHASRDQWTVETFASWVELKAIKDGSRSKPGEDLCNADYKIARWFPDPITELLLLRWCNDFRTTESFITKRRHQTLLFSFLRKTGVPKRKMPGSISVFTRWASHASALEVPPYMHSVAYGHPETTAISPESWLRMYSGRRVEKYDSSIKSDRSDKKLKYSVGFNAQLIPLSEQYTYTNRIKKKLSEEKPSKADCINLVRSMLGGGYQNAPSLIAWLIAAFILKLLQHGGTCCATITVSGQRQLACPV